jgi:hypothetical protein
MTRPCCISTVEGQRGGSARVSVGDMRHPSLPRLDFEPIVQPVIAVVESGGLLANGALI